MQDEHDIFRIAEELKDELPLDPPPPAALVLSDREPLMPAKFESYRILEDGSCPQWDAICEVVELFEQGKKLVMLEAPTGAGKTLIAESVRRLLQTRGVFTCTSLSLQDQFEDDFGEYADVLKGRRNYPTLDFPSITADECTKEKGAGIVCSTCAPSKGWASGRSTDGMFESFEQAEEYHCAFCHPVRECPYEVAKKDAIRSRLAVLNTAYLLAETNYVQRSGFRGHPFIIMDEADTLEDQLMNFVQVQISPGMRKRLGIGLPAKKTVDEAWVEWLVDEVIPAINRKQRQYASQQEELFDQGPNPDLIRKRKTLQRLEEQIAPLVEVSEDGKEELRRGWVYTGYSENDDNFTVTFKPLEVSRYGQGNLWQHGQKFLIMSATFLSPDDTAEQLGIEEDEWGYVQVDYSFDPMRRPVVIDTVGKINNKNKREMFDPLAEKIAGYMDRHQGVRILVHTNSYEFTREIFFRLRDMGREYSERLETYLNSKDRALALNRYLDKPDAVLLAPSFDRGIDLPDDLCRVQVIVKVPYPFLGDKQISGRAFGTGYSGKVWYQMQALRSMIQMTGRGMRHEDDYCRTYVLDGAFATMWRSWKRLFPPWWASAIVWDENDPKWEGLIG